jgi:dolichol-phosphate mannosyltransferase
MKTTKKPAVTIVLPTYNEAENISRIIPLIANDIKGVVSSYEILVVDDNSPDGTCDVARNLHGSYPVRVICRTGKRGLSSAIYDGFSAAQTEIIGVMDADLSHPTNMLPSMIQPIHENMVDLTIGSRYCKKGGVEKWGLFRRLVSIGATLFAKILTPVKDPMSGFFFLKKNDLEGIVVKSKGYKILLEILVKLRKKNKKALKVKEIPYYFRSRDYGSSKLDTKQYLLYLRDIAYLLRIKFGRKLN